MRAWMIAGLVCILMFSTSGPVSGQGAGDGGKLMGPNIALMKAEMDASRSEYLGSAGGTCKSSAGLTCYKNGACCASGSLCKILYGKIRVLAKKIPGESPSPNFCN